MTTDINSVASRGRSLRANDYILGWSASGEVRADTLREALTLGFQNAIGNAGDLNSSTDVGFHSFDSPTNAPPGEANGGALLVVRGESSADLLQISFGHSGKIQYRNSTDTGSSWSVWKRIDKDFATDAQIFAGVDQTAALNSHGVLLALSNRERNDANNITRDAGNSDPRGLTATATTLYSFDRDANAYGYFRSTLRYNSANTFRHGNSAVFGADLIHSHLHLCTGTAIEVFDTAQNHARLAAEDPTLVSANANPVAIVHKSDGSYRTFDNAARKSFRYLSNDTHVPGEDWALDTVSNPVTDAWTDGDTVWVASSTGRVLAYVLDTGERLTSLDIRVPSGSAAGVWSDGELTMWIATDFGNDLLAYHLPGAIRPIGLATADRDGLVRRATSSHVTGRTDDALYLTVLRTVELINALVPSATNAQEGKVRISTDAEFATPPATGADTLVPNLTQVKTISSGTGGTGGTSVTFSNRADARDRKKAGIAVDPVSLKDFIVNASHEFDLDSTHLAPSRMAFDGSKVYILGTLSGSVANRFFVYDYDSGALDDSYSLHSDNDDARGIAVRGNLVYVLNYDSTNTGSRNVFAYNKQNGTRSAADEWDYYVGSSPPSDPQGLAWNGDHFALLDNNLSRGRMFTYGSTGTRLSGVFNSGAGLDATSGYWSIRRASNDHSYFFIDTAESPKKVYERRLQLSPTRLYPLASWDLPATIGDPDGLAFDATASLWLVLDATANTVYSIDDSSKLIVKPGVLPEATETTLGGVTLANVAEGKGLANAKKPITPDVLNEIAASETQKGILRLSDKARTSSGTVDDEGVSPKRLKEELDERFKHSVHTPSLDLPVGTLSGLSTRVGSLAARGDELFALDTLTGNVRVYNMITRTLVTTVLKDSANDTPVGIAIHGDLLYILDGKASNATAIFVHDIANNYQRNTALDIPRASLQTANANLGSLAVTATRIYISDTADDIIYAYVKSPFAAAASENIALSGNNTAGGVDLEPFVKDGVQYLWLLDDNQATSMAYAYSTADQQVKTSLTLLQSTAIAASVGIATDYSYVYVADQTTAGTVLRVYNFNSLKPQDAGDPRYATEKIEGPAFTATDAEALRKKRRDRVLTANNVDALTATDAEAIAGTDTDKFTTPAGVKGAIDDREVGLGAMIASATGITDPLHGTPLPSAVVALSYRILEQQKHAVDLDFTESLIPCGTLRAHLHQAIAINPGTFEAYIANNHLRRLNLFTGEDLPLRSGNGGVVNFGISEVTILAMAFHGGRLYGVGNNQKRVFEIDTNTGQGTYISSSVTPPDNDPLSMMSDGSALFVFGKQHGGAPRQINLTTGAGAALPGRTSLSANEIVAEPVAAFARATAPSNAIRIKETEGVVYDKTTAKIYGHALRGNPTLTDMGALQLPSNVNVLGAATAAGGEVYMLLGGTSLTTNHGLYRLAMKRMDFIV